MRGVQRRRTGRPFNDDVAVVTGGASGIGRALSAALVRRGATVVIADLDGDGARRVASSLGGGPRALGVELDVRDRSAFSGLIDDVSRQQGRLDLLCNNAGVVIGGETHSLDPAHWERVIDVNLMGVVNGVTAAYPLMVSQGHGTILNTASLAGLAPAVFVVAYSASKHAVVGLSAALRPEAASHGVQVNVLCPGAVDTPILDAGVPADLPPQRGRHLSGREYMAVAGLRPVAADVIAERALRGLARDRSVIVAPMAVRAIWYLARFSPALAEHIGRVMVRRVQRAMPDAPRLLPPTLQP